MALNFPDSPGIGSIFTDTNSGFSYKWDGTVWNGFVGQSPSEIKVLTDISGSFDGSETTFALAYDGSAVHPVNAAQLRVVLGGVVQSAGSDYTISTSNIIFTTAPIAALDCTITLLGTALALNDPADESVTPAKLSTGGPSWNTSGDVYISGVTTANNGLVVGAGITLGDNVKLNLGASDDLQIVHDGSNSIIDDAGTGSLILKSDTEIKFLKRTGDENILIGTPDGSVAAFYDNTKRLETTDGGALVYGTVGAAQTALVVEGDGRFTGVVTATTFSGSLNGTATNASGATGDFSIADKIVHTGDTDTAIRFPAADTFTVETSGSERMRIDSSGRATIGGESASTSGPQYAKLQVLGNSFSANNSALFSLRRDEVFGDITAGEDLGVITFADRTGNVFAEIHGACDGTTGSSDFPGRLTFYTTADGASSSSERMRIDSSGRVGIGLIPHAGSGYALQIDGGATSFLQFFNDTTGETINDGFVIGNDSATAYIVNKEATPLVFRTSNTERMRIASDGVITVKNGAVAEIDTLTSAATVTPDFAASCNFTLTLGQNLTIANPSNLTAGQSGSIFLIQDGTGSRTAGFGTHWDFVDGTAPTLSTAASSVDRLDYLVRSSTSIHAVVTLAYS